MKLYFENASGEMREIAEVDDGLSQDEAVEAALHTIHAFCDERQFRIFYVREMDANRLGKPMLQFDVGSHAEFFFLEKPEQQQ